jgi:hypothetical protein
MARCHRDERAAWRRYGARTVLSWTFGALCSFVLAAFFAVPITIVVSMDGFRIEPDHGIALMVTGFGLAAGLVAVIYFVRACQLFVQLRRFAREGRVCPLVPQLPRARLLRPARRCVPAR